MDDSELPPQPRRLSLIDVSCEDDSLIDSFAGDFKFSDTSEDQETRSHELFGGFAASKLEVVPENVELSDQVIEPLESLEPEVKKKKGKKYNLRESLAWDSAFLTDAGVLDSEEISSMMEGDKSQKWMLSGIQEEVCRSTDTISTLESDTLTLESMEANLFEDVRASIQKSSRASYAVDESPKVGSGVTKKAPTSASKGVDHASQDKVASKKSSIDVQKPGVSKRQAIRCPQVSRSVSITGDSSKSLLKRPKVSANPIPCSAASTKRASTGGTLLKMEKDNVKSAISRRDSVATASFSSRIVPKTRSSSKSATLGVAPATKREVASSSFDRSRPTSSNNTGKSPSNSKKKTDTRTDNSPSSSNFKPAPRIEPRKNIQSGKSFLSSNVLPGTKLLSSISPASSVSEWSSESSRASLETISLKSGSADFDAAYMVDLPNHGNDVSSLGHETRSTVLLRKSGVKAPGDKNGVLPPTSKPSGLRLPSPKIGFFDGVKSAGSTPKGGNQPHPPIPSSLPKAGTGSVSLSGGQRNGKLGKLQPTRTVMKAGTKKPDSQLVASDMKPKSPIPLQHSSNAAKKVSTPSRNNVSPNVESKVPPKSGMENQLKDEQIATEGHGIDIREQDDCFVKRNGSIALSNDDFNPELMGSSIVKPAKVIPIEGDSTSLCDSTSTMDADKIASKKVIGDAALGLHYVKHDVDSLNAFKEREDLQIEEQVHDLSRQVGAMNISAESQQLLVGESLPSQI